MATSTLHNLLSTLLFLSTIFHFPAATTPQECPYPCFPPPIGPGDNPPATTTPPASTAPPATTTPPASTAPPASFSPPALSTNPPAGIFPYNPPTPTFYGGAQPPPEPMLPWFPYYYRKPPHQDQSSSTAAGGLRTIAFVFPFFVFFSFKL